MTMKKHPLTIRQGDVALVRVDTLPAGCTEVPYDKGRIVLAYGEVTGHSHAIADHLKHESERSDHQVTTRAGAADEITEAAIARAQAKARLLVAANGERYLEVKEPVSLRHEEHTAHTIPPGIYHLPRQVEYVSPEFVRQVED